MRRVFKWLMRGIGAAAVLLALGAVAGYTLLTSSLPARNGQAALPGLAGQVRVVRDRHGIPHIEAQNLRDAYRALGFVHAQDRLWQMHVLRMVAQGRLSEMFGKATVNTDIFLRTVDIAGASRASFDALSADARDMLQAYADGVNAYLGRDTRLFETVLPPEFLILGAEMEPWEPWQSIALIKVMAVTLDANMADEIARFALASRGFGPQDIDDLMPYSLRDDPPPLPDLRAIYEFRDRRTADKEPKGQGSERYGEALAWRTGISASNNWVVAGARTESGKPLLANDPHLGMAAPAVFYLAHLAFPQDGEERHVIGGSLPGTPLVLVGRNERVAWGLTTTNLDSQDVYIERLKPDDPGRYLTPDGWMPFEAEPIEIKVKDAQPVRFTRRMTRHGPVLPETYRGLSEILPVGHVAALQWGTLAHDDTTVEGALGIAVAKDVSGFVEAVQAVVAPMQSMVVADRDGNIGLIAPGRVPMRDPGNRIAGRAPVPGWLSVYDWKGSLAFDALPRIVNPDNGALATANANWLPAGYDRHITYDWDEHFRQARVEELVVAANGKHSPQTMKAIQSDAHSAALVAFRDEALAQFEQGAGQDPAMLEALRNWDGHMFADRPEPLVLTAWWRHFQEALFGDELGKEYVRLAQGYLEPVLRILRGEARRDWCDDTSTSTHESCGLILSRSLTRALEEISVAQGGDWRGWRWGKAHPAFGEHRPFSSVAMLSRYFTVLQESAGGSYTLLRGRTDFSEDHPYYSVHASAYRAWYDLGDPDKSEFIVSTGQSGHFLSPHYRDLAPAWARVEYLPMTTRRQDYETDREGIWLFGPAK